ncbi:FecR family protein [Dyadobacter psychrotolerans]|uniref:FecR family protein n=1 Tax=Dyadobacter psychrotolerans TaxID=2541721 RepID=A0A4R5DIB8_9BACT|nr:FecR domain-containing protein [Dyadobacter psychrotolerans]TDE10505.1 FecR family protein [Dyadobacter psychrotolerans]
MHNSQVDPELLRKYLQGKCNPQESFLVEQWYAAINKESASDEPFDQQAHLKSIQEKIGLKIDSGDDSDEKIKKFWPKLTRYATAAFIVLVCGVSFYLYRSGGLKTMPLNNALTTIANTHKQVKKHFLPDGSVVWLNPNAVLSYSPEAFSATSREVNIQGEAFLDVTKDASRPFLVRTAGLLVRVLGTSFNVKANDRQKHYEVSVVSGKVQVSTAAEMEPKKYVMLLPTQKAVFQLNTGVMTATQLGYAEQKAETWQPVSLTFEDENLGEVIKRLQTKFGISIRLADKDLNNCFLKATFENNRLSEILETTTQMLNASYEMEGDSIVIYGEGCQPEEDKSM